MYHLRASWGWLAKLFGSRNMLSGPQNVHHWAFSAALPGEDPELA